MYQYFGRQNEAGDGTPIPARIKAAFWFLNHVRCVTMQSDASIPARDLSALEKSVEAAALRALQQYLLGEMDFAESAPPAKPIKRDHDEDEGTAPTACPT
jgi:hypothetical protein